MSYAYDNSSAGSAGSAWFRLVPLGSVGSAWFRWFRLVKMSHVYDIVSAYFSVLLSDFAVFTMSHIYDNVKLVFAWLIQQRFLTTITQA